MLIRTLTSGRRSLIVIVTLLTLLALVCWWNWDAFLAWSLATQITLHRYLVLHLLQINNGQYSGGLWLLFFTFLYGVLHAVGPGHGKFVVTTWLSTQQQQASPVLRAVPLVGSLVQGLSAILFLFVLAVGFNLVSGDLSLSRWVMEKASALLIAAFGGWMLLRGLRAFPFATRKATPVTQPPAAAPIAMQASADAVTRPWSLAPRSVDAVSHPYSVHDAQCGCGHHHIPLVQPTNWKELLGVIAAIGLRPCSGAITVLLFSNAIGIVTWGMLAVMTMALGTGLSLLLLAIAVSRLRDTVAAIWLRDSPTATTSIIALVRIAAGVLLMLFALVLFLTVVPVSPNGDFIAAGC
ncbi:ABC-type nickel/cobalt efflux system permease component RcnA [Pantoea alhagi]|uniref:nickel/cobalt transporter n=1 Tax=Mixta sp. BE291 TaxID=3158787 RepID=UPI00285F88AE|nr:ABC-type nickel/cobalt efflux system permease component RcnA [Pantoea alhagi]